MPIRPRRICSAPSIFCPNGPAATPYLVSSTIKLANTPRPVKFWHASRAVTLLASTPAALNRLLLTLPRTLRNLFPPRAASNFCKSRSRSPIELYDDEDSAQQENWYVVRTARRSLLAARSEILCRPIDKEARPAHFRKVHRHPQASGHHLSARLHANRRKALSRNHGHRRGLVRLRSRWFDGFVLRPVRPDRIL